MIYELDDSEIEHLTGNPITRANHIELDDSSIGWVMNLPD